MQGINEHEYDQLVLSIQKEVKELQTSSGWESFTDGKVKGYKKKSTSDSLIIKAQTVINIALEKIVDFFKNEDSMKKINDSVIQNKVIHERNGKYKILHFQIKTPFPMDNRESIILTTWINEGNKVYLGSKSCNYPIQLNPKFVTAHTNIAGWIFEKIDNNSTKVTNLSDMDPRGNVPDFFKNAVAEKRVQSLKDLEDIIRKN